MKIPICLTTHPILLPASFSCVPTLLSCSQHFTCFIMFSPATCPPFFPSCFLSLTTPFILLPTLCSPPSLLFPSLSLTYCKIGANKVCISKVVKTINVKWKCFNTDKNVCICAVNTCLVGNKILVLWFSSMVMLFTIVKSYSLG